MRRSKHPPRSGSTFFKEQVTDNISRTVFGAMPGVQLAGLLVILLGAHNMVAQQQMAARRSRHALKLFSDNTDHASGLFTEHRANVVSANSMTIFEA